jgi:hypothetical protein
VSSKHKRSSPGDDSDKKTDRTEETHGENPRCSFGQDGSKCVNQDRTSLSSMSSIPKVKSTTGSRWNLLRPRYDLGELANASDRRAVLGKMLGLVVLAALMGLTSWVVASISTWMVPVYVTAMVLIFVIPQVHHQGEQERASEPVGVSADQASETTSLGSLGTNSQGVKPLQVDDLARASAVGTRPPASITARRQQPRGQGRKAGKTGPEQAVATAPAAWIRIGPGKFVRADSQDQGYASAPMPHTALGATKASIEVEGSPPDVVKETNLKAVSTAAHGPNWADFKEPVPSPEHETLSEEPAAVVDSELDSLVVAPMLKADVACQELGSSATSATTEVDGGLPADSVVTGPVSEVYGIAPSAFGPSPLEASLQEEDHEQGWTDLPDSTKTATKTLADARDSNGDKCSWIRLRLRSSAPTVSGYPSQRGMPRLGLQNVRSKGRRRGFRELSGAANYAARANIRRNFGRSSKVHCGYQPRSPPARF